MSMWLDRRPGPPGNAAGAPQPNSRPISPLPRRTSSSRGPYLTSSQRHGGTPRGSNLSLVSNDSSSSLLASSKRANGSTLKQSTTVEDAPGPEEVLARILGPSPGGETSGDRRESRGITEDDLDLDFDFGGLALRELANSESPDGGVVYRSQTIADCRLSQALSTVSRLRSLAYTKSQTSEIRPSSRSFTGPFEHAMTSYPPLRRTSPASAMTWLPCQLISKAYSPDPPP